MRNAPEKEEDGKAAADGAHKIHADRGCMGFIAEEDYKETTQENEQRSAGRVGNLQLIAAGDELTAIPERTGGFHGHHIDCTGDEPHDPANDVVYLVKTHWMLKFYGQN